MSATNDRGFVDLMGTVTLVEEGGTAVTGVVDVYYCGDCLEQAAKLIGSASKAEVESLVFDSVEKDNEIEKLKDEVQAWQQRFETMVSQITGDVDWKEVLKEKRDPEPDPKPA